MTTRGTEPLVLIITCEDCKQVKRYSVKDDFEAENIFKNYRCSDQCNKSFLSYIIISELHIYRTEEPVDSLSQIVF